MAEFIDYETCKYFVAEDDTPWHSDIFDHPSYKYYCTKTGEKREIYFPSGQCLRCIKNNRNKKVE